MRFNLNLVLRGRPIISWIGRNKKINKVEVELDRFYNRSFIRFDPICFQSSVLALNEYLKKGGLSYEPAESCQSQFDLDSFSLDLSNDKKFSVKFDLADLADSFGLILKSNNSQISLLFNQSQLVQIIEKLKTALDGKEAIVRAEKETVIRSQELR